MTYGITNNHEHPDDSDSSQKTKEQWLNEGSIHYRAKRYSEALITCERAIKIDKNFVRAHFAKGLVLIALKRYEEATEALKQAAQLNVMKKLVLLFVKQFGSTTAKQKLTQSRLKSFLLKERHIMTEDVT